MQNEKSKSPKISWRMKGKYIKSCNCELGCPCDFWGKPTHTKCEGMLAMEVDEGNFGSVPLKGVKFVATYHWPGPLHEGNGTIQPFVDSSATKEQRDAVLTIMSGKAGNPWFEIVTSLASSILEPQFVPISFDHNMNGRQAKVTIPGVLEMVAEPIKNLADGKEHRIRVQLPQGMEYKVAETAKAVVNKSMGKIKYSCPNGHSSLAYVEHTNMGLMS